MAQVTAGTRSILSHPIIYDLFQRLIGVHAFRTRIVNDYFDTTIHMRILDIGCGTADILNHLPETIDYIGFDMSSKYIEQARARFPNRGIFFARLVTEATLESMPPFDLVFAMGVLHHLNDDEAIHLFSIADRSLKPGGKMITIDPCYEISQNPIARFIISRDRGQNVRNLAQYRTLAEQCFQNIDARCLHDLLRLPYTHALIQCQKAGGRNLAR